MCRLKVVIVDDERNALENLQMKMENVPQISKVETFRDPRAAFNYISQNPIDVVFLDVEMPEMSGIEIAQRLKKITPQLNVVFVTAHDVYARDAFKVKACDYITKPATIEAIQNAVKNLRHPVSNSNKRIWIQTFPFLHRSESFTGDESGENDNSELNFKGKERDAKACLILAGEAYERGDLNTAQKLALSVNAKLNENFMPEIKLCALLIYAAVLSAQNQAGNLKSVFKNAREMIEQHKAYYLNENLDAFVHCLKFQNGDRDAAKCWLKDKADLPCGNLSFYKMYQHFVTARAHIVVGDYNTAIALLKSLRELAEQYRRPLDIIEVDILLSIAYWKKNRIPDFVALGAISKAVLTASAKNYTQLFINDGAELSTMLHKLYKQIIQPDYIGELNAMNVKNLYISSLSHAKFSPGMSGGRTQKSLKFTEQQRIIMKYLDSGFTHKEMAQKMGIKPSTIKTHMSLIYKKLDVSNAVEAMIKIRELDILSSEN